MADLTVTQTNGEEDWTTKGKDFGDGTYALEQFNRAIGALDDTKETDPDQDASTVALLKGILQALNSMDAKMTSGVNVNILP